MLKNNEVIGNIMVELTRMKEKMASMQSEINSLKEENKQLRNTVDILDQTNTRLLDKVIPEWRDAGKKRVPKLRIVA